MPNSPLAQCPAPPTWNLPWEAITDQFDWIRAMRGVSQNPSHHAEGDVYTHVRMVCEELIQLEEWRSLDAESREELFAAALLHDVSKPECWRVDDDGQISTRGHSRKGEIRAREILWRSGIPRERRERVCALVRHHMLPFHLLNSDNAEREAIAVAEQVSWAHLAIHALADGRGRISPTRDAVLEQVDLALEFAHERGCGAGPFPFSNDHARFLYFRGERARPDDPAWEEPTCTVTLLSGLPGAGKDTWIRKHRPDLPVVSLDRIRSRLGVAPTDNQGTVIQEAREEARTHLRAKRDFVWNATNVTRQVRRMPIGLFAQYGTRIEIVAVETTPEALFEQNRSRANAVPDSVLSSLIRKWEAPNAVEAHAVHWCDG